jgi:hypothetical protein
MRTARRAATPAPRRDRLPKGIRSRKSASRQRDAELAKRPDPSTPPVCGQGSTIPSLDQASIAGIGSFGTH